MLKEYYEIVKGNATKVRKVDNAKMRADAEKRTKKLEAEKQLEKIRSGQITVADNLDLIAHGISEYCAR